MSKLKFKILTRPVVNTDDQQLTVMQLVAVFAYLPLIGQLVGV
jgi:hypothetical protein